MSKSAVLLALAASVFAQEQVHPGKANLRNPEQLKEKAPEIFKAKFDTSKGVFVVEVRREWAPRGADRFYNLVKNGFYDDVRFFRVVPNLLVQFGMSGDPAVQAIWDKETFPDDRVTAKSNARGTVAFANAGPHTHTRTTQVFINYKDNQFLDDLAFEPFGQVIEGMDVTEKIAAPDPAQPPLQIGIRNQGNAYLDREFPKLDYVKKATLEP